MSRLPTVNGDEGTWGAVLNDYLSQSLANDGSIRSNAVDTSQLKDGAVTGAKIATGAVTAASVGLGNVDNTSDTNKPISSAAQSALDLKAPLASPAFTGTPTVPTPTAGTNTTQIASTAFVATAVTNATLADATTSTKGKVQLADAADIAGATGTDVLSAGQIPSSQGVTGIAKVQFIANGGTVTGNPGPYTIIIEAGP